MKKIKYIALGAFATLLSSCGNDWLDLQSSTAIETDGSLTELRDFEFVLNGAYSSMQSSSYYGADMFCYGDLRGDDMKSISLPAPMSVSIHSSTIRRMDLVASGECTTVLVRT